MCKSFMDMEDGDLCFTTSDNMAMDSEGHMMMRIASYGKTGQLLRVSGAAIPF